MLASGFFARRARDGIEAACEALFPANDLGAPDFRATDMVERMTKYIDDLPAAQGRLVRALFIAIELGCLLLPPRFRRFSNIEAEQRAALVRGFRRSRFQPFRVLGDALKATTTVIYLSHPAAVAYLGSYKTCDRPGDSLPFPVRPDALR